MKKEEFDTDFEMGLGMIPSLIFEEEQPLGKGPFGNPLKAIATCHFSKATKSGRVEVRLEEEGFGCHTGSAKTVDGEIDEETFKHIASVLTSMTIEKMDEMGAGDFE